MTVLIIVYPLNDMKPSSLRRSSSGMNCLKYDCSKERDDLEFAKSADPIKA